MYFKKLVGKKCYLSPIDVNDAGKYAEWINDLEITINLGPLYSQTINLEAEKKFCDILSNEHNYSIVDLNSNDLIGNCSFLEVDHINQTADIGIFIGKKELWGKGYGTEAMSLLLDYGFKALNLHNVYLRVYPFNERAIKCYEKIGFKFIGKRREAINRNMERHDILLFDILAKDFYQNKK